MLVPFKSLVKFVTKWNFLLVLFDNWIFIVTINWHYANDWLFFQLPVLFIKGHFVTFWQRNKDGKMWMRNWCQDGILPILGVKWWKQTNLNKRVWRKLSLTLRICNVDRNRVWASWQWATNLISGLLLAAQVKAWSLISKDEAGVTRDKEVRNVLLVNDKDSHASLATLEDNIFSHHIGQFRSLITWKIMHLRALAS